MSKVKNNSPYHEVWCSSCRKKKKPRITGAAFLIPARERPYDLILGSSEIDKRVVGVCLKCLADKNEFQRYNKRPVDPNHKDLIYSGEQ